MSSNFEQWNPQKADFYNREFNSYDRGPGKYFSSKYNTENAIRLHVGNLPENINEDGLRGLFSKTGIVTSIWKNQKYSYAFVTMASMRDAESAIRNLNHFEIEKCKISVSVSRNDKEKAILVQQKKEEADFFKKLQVDNNLCNDEDWSHDPNFSDVETQSSNWFPNGDGNHSVLSQNRNAPLGEIRHSVQNLSNLNKGKPLFDPLASLETKSKRNGTSLKKTVKPCKKCGKQGTKRCSECKTPYCSSQCQEKDWLDNHKIECINIYLQTATLKDLAKRFDVNLDNEVLSESASQIKTSKNENGSNGNHDRVQTSFSKEDQFNNQKRLKTEKIKNAHSGKKNSKVSSKRSSSSSQSSQSDVSSPKSTDTQKTIKMSPQTGEKSKSMPVPKQANSPNKSVRNQKGNFRKQQKASPQSTVQKQLDYEEPNSPKNSKVPSKINLPLQESCQVMVTNVASYNEIHVQPIEEVHVRMITSLMTELAKAAGDKGLKFPYVSTPQVGEIYACCFSLDNVWYRAKILSINKSEITVQYIDYGNIEITSCSRMRNLMPELKEFPEQAARCALNIQTSTPCENISQLIKKNIRDDSPYRLNLIHTGDPHIIELYDKDGNVGKRLENLINSQIEKNPSFNHGKSNDNIHQSSSRVIMVSDLNNTFDHLKPGCNFSIFPYHIISPDDFMVQVVLLDSKFHQFNQKLQNCAQSCPLASKKLIQGQVLIVQTKQKQWCRAKMIQIKDSEVVVHLLDHGSVETVSIQEVRLAPLLCLDHRITTVHSKLAEIKPKDAEGWSTKLCTLFKDSLEAMNTNACKGQHIRGEYIGPSSKKQFLWKLIDLHTNSSIADLLVLDGHAVRETTSKIYQEKSKITISDVPKIPLPVGSTQDGIAIDFQADTFFINLIQTDLKEFQVNFNRYLDSAGCTDIDYIPCENEIIAAKFSVDNNWYRGQILDVHNDSIFTVFFIDYGNSECLALNQLKPLPKHFSNYPKQAINCKLDQAYFTKDSLLHFAKLVLNNVCEYKIVSQSDEIYNVNVYSSEGECLNDIFKEISNDYVSETEGSHSNYQTSLPMFLTESSQEIPLVSLESSTSPPQSLMSYHSMVNPEVQSSSNESSQYEILNEQKLSTLSLENQADSDFASCSNSPKFKYFTTNMSCLELKPNNFYKLHCTSVTNADNFYCQLLDDTAIFKYFELMEELRELCNESSEEPSFLPENGQLVAAKYSDDDWYRAKVIDTEGDDVKVFFIDYGNISVVNKRQLREIVSEIFVEFPILAVRCCLTGISKQKWQNDMSKFQEQMTLNVKVVGKTSNSYQIMFIEDIDEQLKVDKNVDPNPLSAESVEKSEKERIQRQIEELQQRLATLN